MHESHLSLVYVHIVQLGKTQTIGKLAIPASPSRHTQLFHSSGRGGGIKKMQSAKAIPTNISFTASRFYRLHGTRFIVSLKERAFGRACVIRCRTVYVE